MDGIKKKCTPALPAQRKRPKKQLRVDWENCLWRGLELQACRPNHQKSGSSENLVAEPDGAVEVPEEEEDARAVVLERSKAKRGGLDLLNFAVKALAQGVGQTTDDVDE